MLLLVHSNRAVMLGHSGVEEEEEEEQEEGLPL